MLQIIFGWKSKKDKKRSPEGFQLLLPLVVKESGLVVPMSLLLCLHKDGHYSEDPDILNQQDKRAL
jgi:hypothetical protein